MVRASGKGDYIPVRNLTAEQLRRYKEPYNWRSHKHYASGRLCVQAYSPDWRASWTKQWRESKVGQLAALIPQVMREIEGAAPELAARIVEAEKKAEAERIAWEAQRKREREEAERARCVKARQDAKQDILSAIAGWDQAMRIHAFFAAAEGAIPERPDVPFADRRGRIQWTPVEPRAACATREGPLKGTVRTKSSKKES